MGNVAQFGGGAYHDNDRTGILSLTNATLSGNVANEEGGGIYIISSGAVTLNNAIIALNDALVDDDISGSVTINSSLVGGDPGFVRNPSPGADGVWGTADDDYGDLQLLSTSPAINAGDNDLLPRDEFDLDGDGNVYEPLPLDLAGSQRIKLLIVDMGAYESGYALPGDANWDTRIDGTDLALWQLNHDTAGDSGNTFAMGDFNGDHKIDGGDLAIWQQNYDPIGAAGISTLAAIP